MTECELALLAALEYAIDIIEAYQMDIRNSEWTGVDLEEKGFCQGRIYLRAIERIRALAEQSSDAKPMTLPPMPKIADYGPPTGFGAR